MLFLKHTTENITCLRNIIYFITKIIHTILYKILGISHGSTIFHGKIEISFFCTNFIFSDLTKYLTCLSTLDIRKVENNSIQI